MSKRPDHFSAGTQDSNPEHPASPAHTDLRAVARQAMLDRGFLVHFSDEVQRQVGGENEPRFDGVKATDLSSWLWSSIDNDDSRDLDQIEYVKPESKGTRLYVGVADVDWFVPLNSAADEAARHNTTSVYTGVKTFPMLPERLSTDLSSLNEGVQRLAMVVEMLIGKDGNMLESSVYPAVVRNRAQLTYDAVAAWLEQNGDARSDPFLRPPDGHAGHSGEVTARVLEKIHSTEELKEQLKLQDRAAGILRQRRHEAGALNFQTVELHPVVSAEGAALDLQARGQNRAGQLIEDFMVAANQVTASFLDQKGFPSMRRVVKSPERWDRIAALAASLGGHLSPDPDTRSLEDFLQEQHRSNPEHFPDLSLSIIKLLGRGEYVIKLAGGAAPGHFCLAVQNYSHSTAPNRRYPDLVMQRLLKAAVSGAQCPYPVSDLENLAAHCTMKEDDAAKVERFVRKCVAAMVLRPRIGERFSGFVTGASEKGTWVRLAHPPVEGKLQGHTAGLEVGDRVHVRLVSTDPERGFIDFQPS